MNNEAESRFQRYSVHIFQRMYGCEWDDETGKVKVYDQFGYDGEDFVARDLETETWIAPTPQAVITKYKWENDRALTAQEKNYFAQICPEWLKKFVHYGRSSLMRTVLPSVSLLQKTLSSPVTCHATGFYPNRAEMFWRKDGVELHEGVEKGEILTNNDGNFQMSAYLDFSSVRSEDWQRYDCVFQLAGGNEYITTKLDKAAIKTNMGTSEGNSLAMIIPIIVAMLVLAVIAVIGFTVYKKRTEDSCRLEKLISWAGSVVGTELESGDSGREEVWTNCIMDDVSHPVHTVINGQSGCSSPGVEPTWGEGEEQQEQGRCV
ncbi:class I histocompatibility antigen, Gogo-C*0203 alpha chain-like [Pelmatolapia mariae]|uniref:class I histocompatibility antigen, Gogo-C*0203 alpha chain-like n=1 Tax=Pelmatolapia mariae TaxID=158779 RepID=UPI003211DE6B